MKLTFTNENLQRLWASAEQQWPNGVRPTYVQQGEDVPRGFWIVGDEGVYMMHNGKAPEGTENTVIYAEECNPETNPDWYDVKRDTFGGDDGVDFIEMDVVRKALDHNGWIEFEFSADSMEINTVWNKGN